MSEQGFRVEIPVHIKRDRRARKVVRQGLAPTTKTVPRIARLLALAHLWEGMVRSGEVRGYAEIARLTGLTRAAVGHTCALMSLAPDLQDKILNSTRGGTLTARQLRAVVCHPVWTVQRRLWPQQQVGP